MSMFSLYLNCSESLTHFRRSIRLGPRMPSSTSCALSFMCLTLLLLLPAQGRDELKDRVWNGSVDIDCCLRVSNATIGEVVIECYIQEKHMFAVCPIDAYILSTQSSEQWCVDPKAEWLPGMLKRLEERGIPCLPLVEPR